MGGGWIQPLGLPEMPAAEVPVPPPSQASNGISQFCGTGRDGIANPGLSQTHRAWSVGPATAGLAQEPLIFKLQAGAEVVGSPELLRKLKLLGKGLPMARLGFGF